jgi:hypothetical protein
MGRNGRGVSALLLAMVVAGCGGGGGRANGRYYEAAVVAQRDLKPEHFQALVQELPKRLGKRPVFLEDAAGRQTPTSPAKLSPAAKQALYIVLETGTAASQEWDLRIRLADDRRVPVTVRRAPGGGFILRQGDVGEKLARGQGKDLPQRYGIGVLVEQGAEWTPRAREVLDLALDALEDRERKVLAAIPFIRRVRGEDPAHGALYKQTDCKAEIFLYDSALRSDSDQFVGEPEAPVATSVRTVLHEVGHAIHQRPGRVAWCAVERKERELRDRIGAVNARGQKFNREQRSLSAKDRDREIAALEAEQRALEGQKDALERQAAAARRVMDRGPVLEAYGKALGKASPPTVYGETSAKESFAESFSLYRADPAALKRLLPQVFDFFARGGHLEP